MPTVYVASKARHHGWWRALRAAGLPISASWIDWPPNIDGSEPTPDQWREHWSRCIARATAADICLFVSNTGEAAWGALTEAGAALGTGKLVYIVSSDQWTFAHHPRARTFPTLEAAITAIMARQAGEAARRRPEKQSARLVRLGS